MQQQYVLWPAEGDKATFSRKCLRDKPANTLFFIIIQGTIYRTISLYSFYFTLFLQNACTKIAGSVGSMVRALHGTGKCQ